ncbi:hypothetical protein [uncultured Duncaniella sp.]|uniref:hypothetical protein n=1 Tax=uncultured Duncaniella sp. TaxID=2768039 RepID=UPI00262CA962|nr:hypothetical protein [uncultured Duncaniella sp.]
MKKFFICAALATVALVSFAGKLEFNTSCGDSYIVEYPDDMTTQELVDRLILLDKALC